jgi:hypothetical protein
MTERRVTKSQRRPLAILLQTREASSIGGTTVNGGGTKRSWGVGSHTETAGRRRKQQEEGVTAAAPSSGSMVYRSAVLAYA